MTTTKAKTDKPTYDPDASYTLTVTRPVRLGPFQYLPRDEITATGALINQLIEENGPDVIRSAEPRA